MNFKKEAEKLLANKYFLYFIIFLSATNVLGYLVSYKFNSAIIFILIGLIMNQFSKNLVVTLLVALVLTNFLAAMGGLREGATGSMKDAIADKKETATTSKEESINSKVEVAESKDDSTDPEIQEAIKTVQDKVAKAKENAKNGEDVIYDHGVQPKESFSSAGKTQSGAKGKGAYIDHAATVEQSYQHLEDILGNDGIKNLTQDTQNLIEKQKKMYENIQNMMPMVKQAQDFLGNLDFKQLNNMIDVAGKK
jgi:F0F1-type ATP synthase beta subunit